MDVVTRSAVDFVLPLPIGGCMALGTLFGFTLTVSSLTQQGTEGDMAGAAGALATIVAFGAGAFASGVATVLARVLRRGVPQRIGLRCGLSLASGIALGTIGTAQGEAATAAMWLLLLAAPAAIAWFWRSGPAATVAAAQGPTSRRA